MKPEFYLFFFCNLHLHSQKLDREVLLAEIQLIFFSFVYLINKKLVVLLLINRLS